MRHTRAACLSLVSFVVVSACGSYAPEDLEVGETQANCTSDDPRIGLDVVLDGRAHDVEGRAAIVDNCTIELRDFHYDGGGLDVRAIGASLAGDFNSGVVLTADLRRPTRYAGETLRIPLPVGVTLNDVQKLSIWCVPAGANFGDADLSGDATRP